jgi:hypothetical protein
MTKKARIAEKEAWKKAFDISSPEIDGNLLVKIRRDSCKIQIFQSHFVKKVMLWLSIRRNIFILAGEGVRLLYFSQEDE